MTRKVITKKEAEQRGRDVKKMMTRPGAWKVRVWNNMGWHWCLISPPVSLYERGRKFRALVSDDPDGSSGGLASWSDPDHKDFLNPQKAVDHAVELAREHVNKLAKSVEKAEKLTS